MNDDRILGPFSIEAVSSTNVLTGFNDAITEFLSRVSAELLKSPEAKRFPDLAAFAFFIRKANLRKMKQEKLALQNSVFLGVGLTFHVASANVPLNFAYSLVSALLCGNPSIVRVSSKYFEQAEILLQKFVSAARRMKIGAWFTFVRYERGDPFSEELSLLCRVRMIWGGNETVRVFKGMDVKENCIDIMFPNKYSMAVVDTKSYLKDSNKIQIARNFYDEVYTFDQNACTSPRAVVWVGDDDTNSLARATFWDRLAEIIATKNYESSISASVKQFSSYAFHAANGHVSFCSEYSSRGATVLQLETISSGIFKKHPGEGLFYDVCVSDVSALSRLVTEECQTILTVGIENTDIINWIIESGASGIDRVCRLGSGSIFSLNWDGKDLFAIMTRKFTI